MYPSFAIPVLHFLPETLDPCVGDIHAPCPAVAARPARPMARSRRLSCNAIDAAMPFDFEARQLAKLQEERRLTIGLIGFGNFGQFIARRMIKAGHKVIATSRGDYSQKAKEIGARFFHDADDFCEEHPQVVVLCSSIISTEPVLKSLPLQRLRRKYVTKDRVELTSRVVPAR